MQQQIAVTKCISIVLFLHKIIIHEIGNKYSNSLNTI